MTLGASTSRVITGRSLLALLSWQKRLLLLYKDKVNTRKNNIKSLSSLLLRLESSACAHVRLLRVKRWSSKKAILDGASAKGDVDASKGREGHLLGVERRKDRLELSKIPRRLWLCWRCVKILDFWRKSAPPWNICSRMRESSNVCLSIMARMDQVLRAAFLGVWWNGGMKVVISALLILIDGLLV